MYCWCRLPQGYVWLCHTFVVVSCHVHGRLWCRLCVVDLWVCFECVQSSFGKGQAAPLLLPTFCVWLGLRVGLHAWRGMQVHLHLTALVWGRDLWQATSWCVWVCYPVLSRLQQQCLQVLAGAAQS